jgi:hypothetical protein
LKKRINSYRAVNHSAGPFAEGCVPTLLISIFVNSFRCLCRPD